MAACSVIISHSYPVALGIPDEPLIETLGYSLGAAAVKVFFAISGFLILQSFERRSSLVEFFVARFLRLIPALLLVSFLLVFLVGPLFTKQPLGYYFSTVQTITYVPRTLLLPSNPASLPGLFLETPFRGVNGPLWTLHYEAICYTVLALAGSWGVFEGRRYLAMLGVYLVAYVLLTRLLPTPSSYAVFSLPFVVGMTIHRFKIPLRWEGLALLSALSVTCYTTGIAGQESSAIALGYAALWLGQLSVPYLSAYNRLGDYSYGVYIYGWPLQQICISLIPGTSPMVVMAFSLPTALAFGIASWHLIERPALLARRPLTLVIEGRFRQFKAYGDSLLNP